MIRVIVATGALQTTESLIEQLLEQSLEALNTMNIDAAAREVLTGLAFAATRRSM